MDLEQTLSEREATHGNFADNAQIAQLLKGVVSQGANYYVMTPTQLEALDMICHKIARIVSGNPDIADHWHDIAGYATLVDIELCERLL